MPKEDPFVRCMNLSVGAFQAATPDTVRECRTYAQERNRTDNLVVNDKAAQ